MKTTVKNALEAAVRAPSPHNTQPWRFEVRHDRIDVLLDRARILRVVDPGGREARMSCGAALLNLRLALAAADAATRTDLAPDTSRPDLLATVHLGGTRSASIADRTLASAIVRRRTNRRPFDERPIPERARKSLYRAALDERCRAVLVDEPGLYGRVAALIRRAVTTQQDDPAFQSELRNWITTDPGRRDGVPPIAGGPPPAEQPLVPLREYGPQAARTPRVYEQQPLLAVLVTTADSALEHVKAGQGMQRMLLSATSSGISASFLSAAVELPKIREELRGVLERVGYPQVVLRFGYGPPEPATPRRPVAAIATTVGESTSLI